MCFLPLLFAVVPASCSSDPPHGMIEQAYFKCDAKKTLAGGLYGVRL